MNFFNEIDFDKQYKEFLDHLTPQEYIKFNNTYQDICALLDRLMRDYNDIVSERLTKEAQQQFITQQRELALQGKVNYKDLILKAKGYNLSLWDVESIVEVNEQNNVV